MNSPRIGLIWAQARGGVIGKDGAMPWHLPEDLAHFKRTTLNHPVVMGRRTWDSIPPRFRPLPGRRNIVITRQPDWHQAGAERAASLAQARQLCAGSERIWVIGGAQIFEQALPLADEAVITAIDADFAGDAFAPTLDASWQQADSKTLTAANGLGLTFATWRRRRPLGP